MKNGNLCNGRPLSVAWAVNQEKQRSTPRVSRKTRCGRLLKSLRPGNQTSGAKRADKRKRMTGAFLEMGILAGVFFNKNGGIKPPFLDGVQDDFRSGIVGNGHARGVCPCFTGSDSISIKYAIDVSSELITCCCCKRIIGLNQLEKICNASGIRSNLDWRSSGWVKKVTCKDHGCCPSGCGEYSLGSSISRIVGQVLIPGNRNGCQNAQENNDNDEFYQGKAFFISRYILLHTVLLVDGCI